MTNSEAPRNFKARHFDHEAPTGEPADVRVGATGLSIDTGARSVVWRFDELRSTRGDFGDEARLEHAASGALLTSQDPGLLRAIRRAAPQLSRSFAAGPSRVPFPVVVALAVSIVTALAVTLFVFGIPAFAALAARSIPPEWERQMGAAIVSQVAPADQRVDDPRVTRAIDRIVSRLNEAAPITHPLQVVIAKRPEVNALAAPGGHIAVFSGLVLFAQSPEELAAVLAHEMEHVERRHVTQSLFQQASLGLLLMILFGDTSGLAAAGIELASSLGKLSFSRTAELEADQGGFQRILAARIDPGAMPQFLDRMSALTEEQMGLSFLSTHPAPAERARRLRETLARIRIRTPDPLLTELEWKNLRTALGAS